jgi:hypothetical protein
LQRDAICSLCRSGKRGALLRTTITATTQLHSRISGILKSFQNDLLAALTASHRLLLSAEDIDEDEEQVHDPQGDDSLKHEVLLPAAKLVKWSLVQKVRPPMSTQGTTPLAES